MAAEYMFAVGTIGLSTRCGRKGSTLLAAASHNRRTIQSELGAKGHIDPSRSALNETLRGPPTPQGVVALATSMMAGAGLDVKKPRKDYTQAIELLFSLPAGAVVDESKFFARCLEWTGERLGLGNVLSADVHRDESTPHCHVLVLPLVDGKMQGSALIDRAATAALRDSFYKDVAKRFGLSKPTGKMTGVSRAKAARAVLNDLESHQDAILRSTLWTAVKREIERNPAPYVAALGIEMLPPAAKQPRTMAQIFTSPGKGPKTESSYQSPSKGRDSKPIGFANVPAPAVATADLKPIGFEMGIEGDRNLSCVGFDDSVRQLATKPAPPETPPAPAPAWMEVAKKAQQEAMGKHTGPRSPHRQTKVAQAIKTASEGSYRVQDADPLPEGW